ncbi:MAG: isocitrate/isopropylmalate family dehydrogenase, partial [Dokdonella sp.]
MGRTIAVIRGDGIGPEIMESAIRVLDALDIGLEYEFVEAGVAAYQATGELLPAATLETIARHKVALKGPLMTPIGGGFSSINVQLRKHFDLYANVRPVITFPDTKARYQDIDLITVRENTEGAYSAEGQTISEDGEIALSMARNTRHG